MMILVKANCFLGDYIIVDNTIWVGLKKDQNLNLGDLKK